MDPPNPKKAQLAPESLSSFFPGFLSFLALDLLQDFNQLAKLIKSYLFLRCMSPYIWNVLKLVILMTIKYSTVTRL